MKTSKNSKIKMIKSLLKNADIEPQQKIWIIINEMPIPNGFKNHYEHIVISQNEMKL